MTSCYRCKRDNTDENSLTFFSIPSRRSNSDWRQEFLERLGIVYIDELAEDTIKLCELHFKPEHLEMKDNVLVLKENAVPLSEDEEAELFEIKPEVVYMNDADEVDESNETPQFTQLAPVVHHEYDENQESDTSKSTVDAIPIVSGAQFISVVQEDGTTVEPMMPFYLSSSPMFILNENKEVRETIILQIQNHDGEQSIEQTTELGEKQIEKTKTHYSDVNVTSEELCKPQGDDITNTYICDICNNSYGCVNCLKSHYESVHVANVQVIRYKCKWSMIPKTLYCPVCEQCFATRSETLDHYITHSVACSTCGSGFDRQQQLAEHMEVVHKKIGCYTESYECEFCRSTYQYHWNLTKHYQAYHKMILCYVCKSRFHSVSELQEHEKVHVRKLDVLPYACSICNKAFPQISDIAVHIRQDHKKTTLNLDDFTGYGRKDESKRGKVIVKRKKIKMK